MNPWVDRTASGRGGPPDHPHNRRRFTAWSAFWGFLVAGAAATYLQSLAPVLQAQGTLPGRLEAFALCLPASLITVAMYGSPLEPKPDINKPPLATLSRSGLRNLVLVFFGLLVTCAATQPGNSLAGHNLTLYVLTVIAVTPIASLPWLRDLLRQIADCPSLEPLARSEAGSVVAIEVGVLVSSVFGLRGLAGFLAFAFGTTLTWYGGLTLILGALKIAVWLRRHRVSSLLDRILLLPPFGRLPWSLRWRLRQHIHGIGASFIVVIALLCGSAAVAVATETYRDSPPAGHHVPNVLKNRLGQAEKTKIGREYLGDCPGGANALPGADLVTSVPWASLMLFNQWLEPGSGVGADIAGCPGRSFEVRDATDRVFYEIGMRNGVVESVAIASSRHGGCILLDGGSAQLALSMLLVNHVFACAPRATAGHGEYQLLYTDSGTSILIRPIDHPRGNQRVGTPYVELPASAFNLWYSESIAHGLFLWAQLDGGSYWHPRRLVLSVFPYSNPVAVVMLGSDSLYHIEAGSDKGAVGGGPPEWIAPTAIASLAKEARHY